jgi:hypothetical protein
MFVLDSRSGIPTCPQSVRLILSTSLSPGSNWTEGSPPEIRTIRASLCLNDGWDAGESNDPVEGTPVNGIVDSAAITDRDAHYSWETPVFEQIKQILLL